MMILFFHLNAPRSETYRFCDRVNGYSDRNTDGDELSEAGVIPLHVLHCFVYSVGSRTKNPGIASEFVLIRPCLLVYSTLAS